MGETIKWQQIKLFTGRIFQVAIVKALRLDVCNLYDIVSYHIASLLQIQVIAR